MQRVPPSDLDAEAALLGAMLIAPEARDVAFKIVTAADFYRPEHAALFDAIARTRETNPKADPVLLAAEIASRGDKAQAAQTILDLIAVTPSPSMARQYAERVAGCANSRQAIMLGARITDLGYLDDTDSLEQARRMVEQLEPSGLVVPPRLMSAEDFDGLPDEDWLIPDLIGRRHRMMVVAAEKAGKAVLLRQILACASQGGHPFTGGRFEPVRCLYVDCENPARVVAWQHSLVLPKVKARYGWDGSRFQTWHVERGLDIRSRQDRIALEATLADFRPDLVVLGPVYKAFELQPRERDQDAVKAALRILDDLRTRYDFGLILEAHAPFGEKGGAREMRPSDSSFWMRWLESGFGLSEVPSSNGSGRQFKVTWRIERMPTRFPRHLVHGSPHSGELPWVAYNPDGHTPKGSRPDKGETF